MDGAVLLWIIGALVVALLLCLVVVSIARRQEKETRQETSGPWTSGPEAPAPARYSPETLKRRRFAIGVGAAVAVIVGAAAAMSDSDEDEHDPPAAIESGQ